MNTIASRFLRQAWMMRLVAALALLALSASKILAAPMNPGPSRTAPALLPQRLTAPAVPSDHIVAYRDQLAQRLSPFNIRPEHLQPVLGPGHMRQPTINAVRHQMFQGQSGNHFIPLSDDGRGHKVYAMEMTYHNIRTMESSQNFDPSRQKRFVFVGVRQRPPSTALTLHQGGAQMQPEVGLYGFVDAIGLPDVKNVADTYSQYLYSQNIHSILRG